MPDTHRVIVTAQALADLEAIAHYIRERSPQNAAAVAEALVVAMDSLASMPGRFKRVGRSRKHGSSVQALVVRPFIVYYRVEQAPAAVYILTLRHGKRRQPRRFD